MKKSLSAEDLNELVRKENQALRLHHRWLERRIQEYYDVQQPLLFQYLPAMTDLEATSGCSMPYTCATTTGSEKAGARP